MPIQLSVHPERKLAYFRFSGRIDVADCAGVYRDFVSHPQFDVSLLMLSNTKALTHVNGSFTGIVMAAQRLMPLMKAYRSEARSILHVNGDVAFGMARMMQQVIEPISYFRFEITRSESTALALASLPETCFADLDHALGLPGIPVTKEPASETRPG